jgi:large subunit ribosomal protein L34
MQIKQHKISKQFIFKSRSLFTQGPLFIFIMFSLRRLPMRACASKLHQSTTTAGPLNVFQPSALIAPPVITSGLMKGISRITNSFGVIFDLSLWLIKRTWQPSIIKRKRKHGFLYRMSTRHGRKIIRNRNAKKRTRICV